MEKVYTISELAGIYNRDASYMGKLIRGSGIKLVSKVLNGHPCKTISEKDVAKLERKNPEIACPPVSGDYITIDEMAKRLKKDKSSLRKQLIARGFTLEKRVKLGGNRPTNTLSIKDFKRYCKENR